jgi:hypothetical protein
VCPSDALIVGAVVAVKRRRVRRSMADLMVFFFCSFVGVVESNNPTLGQKATYVYYVRYVRYS